MGRNEMVKLQNMNKEDFDEYLMNAIIEYAKEKVKAGTWAEEESIKLSEEAFGKIISNGLETENIYFYTVIDPDTEIKVGYLWFKVFQQLTFREAFLFDIIIYDKYQGKGYGKATMIAFEEIAKELKLDKLSLHVFGHNHRAYELYKKLGFEVTDLNMSKQI
jgi:ribosomal protein S18 acetylase RimI-like enzyme